METRPPTQAVAAQVDGLAARSRTLQAKEDPVHNEKSCWSMWVGLVQSRPQPVMHCSNPCTHHADLVCALVQQGWQGILS